MCIRDRSFTGALRRKCEILEILELVIACSDLKAFTQFLEAHPLIDEGSVHIVSNKIEANIAGKLPLHIYAADAKNFANTLFISTGSENHLLNLKENYGWKEDHAAKSEEEIYSTIKLPFIEPELRAVSYTHLTLPTSDLV